MQALHQQQVGQLTAAADLVMVNIEHRGVDRAADGDKGQFALLQQRDQGVTLQRAGQDDAVDLVVDQQTLHGLGLLLAHHGQQHIVIVAGHHIADGGDGFAQKLTFKVRKLARKHQRNIIGLFGDETFRHHVGNIVFFSGIVYHALAGCFTYADKARDTVVFDTPRSSAIRVMSIMPSSDFLRRGISESTPYSMVFRLVYHTRRVGFNGFRTVSEILAKIRPFCCLLTACTSSAWWLRPLRSGYRRQKRHAAQTIPLPHSPRPKAPVPLLA